MEERDSSLAAFIEMLDTELPEDAKLPRLEDGSINLNKRLQAPSDWAPRFLLASTPAAHNSYSRTSS